MNEEAPKLVIKNKLKEFSFTRNIQNQKDTPQEPGKNDINPDEGNNIFSFILTLYEDEICFNIKERKEISKIANITYEKSFSLENLKNFSKFFSLLNTEKIFELIQKSFELYYDNITFSEDKLIIKLMINMMDIITEEINFEIPKKTMEYQDDVQTLKESVEFLEKERSYFKKEINLLNNTVEELQKKIEQKDIIQQNKIKELKNVIEENKKEYMKDLEEKKNNKQNIIKDFEKIVETNKKEFQNII